MGFLFIIEWGFLTCDHLAVYNLTAELNQIMGPNTYAYINPGCVFGHSNQ
jgi:hypothetical protein